MVAFVQLAARSPPKARQKHFMISQLEKEGMFLGSESDFANHETEPEIILFDRYMRNVLDLILVCALYTLRLKGHNNEYDRLTFHFLLNT